MKATRNVVIGVLTVAIILASSCSFYYLSNLEKKGQNYPLIAIYPSLVPGHDPDNNTEQFLADLSWVKELGFIGVRVHPKDYDDYGYGRVANDLENLDLKFVMVIEFNITNDQGLFDQEITYFSNVARELVDKTNLLWYAIKYPYDWYQNDFEMDQPIYNFQLQSMINEIDKIDPDHKIFLVSGRIDTVATPPTDFENIDGFGIQPYSHEGLIDDLDPNSINWIEKYRETGKEVYISEWGLQTMEKSPNRKYDYGLVSNESMKIELIKEFYDYIKGWNIYWTYFGLHDLPSEESDWGIVYNDNSLKPSGKTFKDLLAQKK